MKNPTPSDIDPDAPAGQMVISSRPLLTEAEAAMYLHVSRSFLAKARCVGGGPQFVKIGRAVRYELDDLREFADQAKRRSTSEYSTA
jgi:hypothetical protein